MNRNARIRHAAKLVMDEINVHKQWRSLTVNGFETQIDVALLGPRQIDNIREQISRIIDEVTEVRNR